MLFCLSQYPEVLSPMIFQVVLCLTCKSLVYLKLIFVCGLVSYIIDRVMLIYHTMCVCVVLLGSFIGDASPNVYSWCLLKKLVISGFFIPSRWSSYLISC